MCVRKWKTERWGHKLDLLAISWLYHPILLHYWDIQWLPSLSTAGIRYSNFHSLIMNIEFLFKIFKLLGWDLRVTCLNLHIRFSIKWGGAQFIPTAPTLSLLFIASRQSLKLSPEGAFSPSTEVKQIQDGICTFSSSSNSTKACNWIFGQ